MIEAYIRYYVENGKDVEGIIKLWNDVRGGFPLFSRRPHYTVLDMKCCPMRNRGRKETLLLILFE